MTETFTPSDRAFKPLAGTHILTIACNLPGPLAVARLVELGAKATKVEPLEGDALELARPLWYQRLHAGVRIVRMNLKAEADGARFDDLLAEADLFMTATRPAGLERLGLDWARLHARYPRLSQVAIVGYPEPDVEVPGHDLNYQAKAGLVIPPSLPRTCTADIAGAERAVSMALALLLARSRGAGGGLATVSLADAAFAFAEPLRHGLTMPDGPLGGSLAGYNLYPALDGWVAVAALEPHFWRSLIQKIGVPSANRNDLERAFRTRTANDWEAWARDNDLPIVAVRDAKPLAPVAEPRLREQLLAMAAEDQMVRAELATDRSLFEGYHPRMEDVHRRNAARLAAIMDAHGWPIPSLAGEDGSSAAWLILQHAIGNPPLQRRGLILLRAAASAGEVPAWQPAYLEDRIRVLEGRPQLYGTQFDWDETGVMRPADIEDPAGVDERRRQVGLGPLEESIRGHREDAARGSEKPPQDWARRRREMEEWAQATGWRS